MQLNSKLPSKHQHQHQHQHYLARYLTSTLSILFFGGLLFWINKRIDKFVKSRRYLNFFKKSRKMCWSYEATLGFCVFESLVLLYIWRRDTLNDRINCIGHLPILGQGYSTSFCTNVLTKKNHKNHCRVDVDAILAIALPIAHS